MWDATKLLLDASGTPQPDNAAALVSAYNREGPSLTTRVWRWLVAAAERGNEVAQFDISAMAWFWGCEWIETIEPNLRGSDCIQLGFDHAPDGTHRALVDQCNATIRQLPEDFIVVTTSLGHSITAGMMARIVELQAQADGLLTVQEATQQAMERR